MKKISLFLCVMTLMAGFISSCKKDEKTTTEKFSTLNVEQSKATVEESGVNFVKSMDRMSNLETIGTLINLNNIMSSMGSKNQLLNNNSKLFQTLNGFIATAQRKERVSDFFHTLATPAELKDDPQSIQEFWDQNVGTYAWNPSISDWDVTLGGTKFIITFPSSDASETNDATFTISDYAGVIISGPIDSVYTGDLPTALKADLKVGTKTLITFTYAGSYSSEGIPSAVALDLTIENFKFEIDITNNTQLVSVNYRFLEGNNVVIDMGASGKGDFTQANLDANTHSHTDTWTEIDWVYNPSTGNYDPIEVTRSETYSDTDFEEILNSASAHFQLFNIVLRGDVDVKGLVDQERIISQNRDNELINQETADSLDAININKYLNLRLVDVTNNQIIARAEAYMAKDVQQYYTDTYVDFRLVFYDNSKVDMATYTGSGFDNFVTEVNNMINDLNTNYDLGIEPIDYKK